MTTYIFNKPQLKIKEKATMQEPDELYLRRTYGNFWNDYYLEESKEWEAHLKQLREHPCHPSCADVWEEGEEVKEGDDFELRRVPEEFACIAIHEYIAYPLPKQESEDDIWEEVEKLHHAACAEMFNQLKNSFTIKRKP